MTPVKAPGDSPNAFQTLSQASGDSPNGLTGLVSMLLTPLVGVCFGFYCFSSPKKTARTAWIIS